MKYFIEISNAVHGGWGIGELLWSPFGENWRNMNKLNEGDRILHIIKDPSENIYKLWGISVVADEVEITKKKPPIPGDYEDYERYYIVPLRNFVQFKEKVTIQKFLDDHEDFLRAKERKSFFTDNGDIKTVQKYLSSLPKEVLDKMKEYMGKNYEESYKELSELETERKRSSVNITTRVMLIILFAALTIFSLFKTIEIIDLEIIGTFFKENNIWETLYLTLSISGLIWTSFGFLTMLFTDGENIGDFWVKVIVRAIVYPIPFIFPIIYLLYNFDFNTLIETSILSGLLAFIIKVVFDIDTKLMNLIYKKNN